ncbi:AraC family transcriptional regulator [Mesorhizobium sp. CAU 1732]|uniref:helix-turn-helix domain-containing protein n=1 Tax=Mesorhizobium sp. CAU 1732 TaxID=3140358 RepID=UPI003261040E
MDARIRSAGIPSNPFADQPLRCAIDMSTSSVQAREQFDLFRSWHEGVFNLQLLKAAQASFQFRQRIWQLGDLTLLSAKCPGPGYVIRWEHRKRPLVNHLMLLVPFKRSAGGTMLAGKPVFSCLALPEVGSGSYDLVVALFLPLPPQATDPLGLKVGDAALSFLADYLLMLYRSLPHLRDGDIPHIVTATKSLIAAALRPSNDPLSAAEGPIAAVITARIARIFMERLADRDLTPDKLCRAVGVSRSQLYRIFEPAGGVSNYIRRKRLLKTHDALADSSNSRTISSIAQEWGFADASTYSRMFKSEFGMSPKEARELGWQGIGHSAWLSADQPVKDVGSLCNLLINNSLGLSLSSKR